MPLNTKVTQTDNLHEVEVSDGGGGGAKERTTDVLISYDATQFYCVSSSPPGGIHDSKGSVLWPKQLIPLAGKKFNVQLSCKFTFINKASRVIATAVDCKGSASDYASHDATERNCGLVLELPPHLKWKTLAEALGISVTEAHELVERFSKERLSEEDKAG